MYLKLVITLEVSSNGVLFVFWVPVILPTDSKELQIA